MRRGILRQQEYKDKQWISLPAVEVIFHQFVTETDDSDCLTTIAIVELLDGSVKGVPLDWLQLLPAEPCIAGELALGEPLQLISDDLKADIRQALSDCSHAIQSLCHELANRR